MESEDVALLPAEFRAARSDFQERARAIAERARQGGPADAWGAREIVVHVAAWLDEANGRIPRLLACAPHVSYDVDTFNAIVVARAADWTYVQALGALRRAADRFEALVSDIRPEEIADDEEAASWLYNAARHLMNEHVADLERLATSPASNPTDARGG